MSGRTVRDVLREVVAAELEGANQSAIARGDEPIALRDANWYEAQMLAGCFLDGRLRLGHAIMCVMTRDEWTADLAKQGADADALHYFNWQEMQTAIVTVFGQWMPIRLETTDPDDRELLDLTVVVDCDLLPGSWLALFPDSDEAVRYAKSLRETDDEERFCMAATAMQAHATSIDVWTINQESEVIG